MVKWFCDKCTKEVKDNARLRVKYGQFEAEVMTANTGVWNHAVLCHPCVLEIVAKGKRVKP